MKTIIIISLCILLSACTIPHIEHKNNTLLISMHNKNLIKATGKLIFEHRVNLINLYIDQKVYLMESGSVITYEDATVTSGYQYNHGMKRTVGIIFFNYSYDLLDTKGNLFFFKLTNREDTQYMILENMNKKRVKMVYGLDEYTFNNIFHALSKNEKIPKSLEQTKQKLVHDKSTYIKSNWSNKNIILDTLITKPMSKKRVKI